MNPVLPIDLLNGFKLDPAQARAIGESLSARPGDEAAIQREAAVLRRDQHLEQWVPPAVLRYSRAIIRRVRRLASAKP